MAKEGGLQCGVSPARRSRKPRREKRIETIELTYLKDRIPTINMAIHQICLNPRTINNQLKAYATQYIFQDGWTDEEQYIFHACGNEVSHALLESFSRRGPSIRFAREGCYFSTRPAVYWTNSLNFALAWALYTETGQWCLSNRLGHRPLEFVVYVSSVRLPKLKTKTGLYAIHRSNYTISEETFDRVCFISNGRNFC